MLGKEYRPRRERMKLLREARKLVRSAGINKTEFVEALAKAEVARVLKDAHRKLAAYR